MKKSQIAVDTLIGLAILAVAVAIVGVLVYPEVKDLFETESTKGACEWSLVVHSLTKLSDFSLVPAECRAHRLEISLDDLEKYHFTARKRIKIYKENPEKYGPVLQFFDNPDDSNQLNEWVLNMFVAKEMQDCWEKVFKGRLPLFDKWWNLYDWGWSDAKLGEQKDYIDAVIGKFKGPPVNCILCSRIRFSDDLTEAFGSRVNIDSLDVWLKNNYPIAGGRSYYEILTDGQSEIKGLFAPAFEYSIDKPLAVLYEKIYYYHGAEAWLDKAFKTIAGGEKGTYELNYLKIVPYTQEDIIMPKKQDGSGGEGCTFLLD